MVTMISHTASKTDPIFGTTPARRTRRGFSGSYSAGKYLDNPALKLFRWDCGSPVLPSGAGTGGGRVLGEAPLGTLVAHRPRPRSRQGGRGAHAGSLLDVFLHDLRGCGRGIIDRAVLLGCPVVRGQVRNGLTGRRAHRQIPGLVAVAFVAGGTRVKHDVRGGAGFLRPSPHTTPPPPPPALPAP